MRSRFHEFFIELEMRIKAERTWAEAHFPDKREAVADFHAAVLQLCGALSHLLEVAHYEEPDAVVAAEAFIGLGRRLNEARESHERNEVAGLFRSPYLPQLAEHYGYRHTSCTEMPIELSFGVLFQLKAITAPDSVQEDVAAHHRGEPFVIDLGFKPAELLNEWETTRQLIISFVERLIGPGLPTSTATSQPGDPPKGKVLDFMAWLDWTFPEGMPLLGRRIPLGPEPLQSLADVEGATLNQAWMRQKTAKVALGKGIERDVVYAMTIAEFGAAIQSLQSSPLKPQVLHAGGVRTVPQSKPDAEGETAGDSPVLPEVNVDMCQVRWAGQCHSVTAEQAYLMEAAVSAYPEWFNAGAVCTKPSDKKNKLPEALRMLLESESGKGYRLKLS